MKKLLLIFFVLPIYLTAQEEFSFQLYFEDALGNRDTVTVGYDENATYGIDTAFGEEDIISLPWLNPCEVRITDFPKTFHTKKQIFPNHCGENWGNWYPMAIHVKNPQFPLNISWDYTIFQNECIIGSVLANVPLHLWFDLYRTAYFMKGSNEITFTNIPLNNFYLNYIDPADSLPVYSFWLRFADSSLITLDTDILDVNKIDIYPNPFNNEFTISSDLPLSDIYVTDLIGNKIDFEIQNNTISLSNDEAKGIYILSFFQAGKRYFYKMMKQ
jgi:hypothetical protein